MEDNASAYKLLCQDDWDILKYSLKCSHFKNMSLKDLPKQQQSCDGRSVCLVFTIELSLALGVYCRDGTTCIPLLLKLC